MSPQDRPLTGCCGFGYNIGAYLKRLSTVEYQQTFFNPPKAAALRRLRDRSPAGFNYVIRAWQLITHEPTSPGYKRLQQPLDDPTQYGHLQQSPGVAAAMEQTLAAAELLDAAVILYETPASFTPTAANRRALSCFFEQVPRQRRHVWDPRGIWDSADVLSICQDLDLTPCCDPFANVLVNEAPATIPEGELAYVKLRGLGGSRHYSESQYLWLAEALEGFSRAYCIFNTVNMFKDATRFEGVLLSIQEGLDSPAD